MLNLPLPIAAECSRHAIAADPDAVVRLAERDSRAAAELLVEHLRPGTAPLADAPDVLARRLSELEPPRIRAWAEAHGISRSCAFRWFRAAYGVAPARFRVEARARRAWRRILEDAAPLATIAAAEGFADQAHMTRDVRALTGRSPAAWR